MTTKRTRLSYTQLPCGLKLRLDVDSGDFDFRGDLGQLEGKPIRYLQLSIVSDTENLMALSAFFLERAREVLLDSD